MRSVTAIIVCTAAAVAAGGGFAETMDAYPEEIRMVLDVTQPLEHERGSRLPLYLWPARNPGVLSDADAEGLVRALDERGIGLYCSWTGDVDATLAQALPVARAQRKLGLRVNVDATVPMHGFCDGTDATAHLDADGQPFHDTSCAGAKLGCPFRLDHRIPVIRERIETLAAAYADEGLPIDFIFADWEIDGPIEWNDNHETAKRCVICREHVPAVDDFLTYQHEVRAIRSRLQRQAYALPLRRLFPDVLVGNYAVYPNDGWRYWYDYFERYVDGQPARLDQRARYRHWANEFATTAYTFAMPVVYQWSPKYAWYDFASSDYRWFYSGLLVASNAGAHTPPDTPIIAFVHWHTVDLTLEGEEKPPQFSEGKYQELLWHMLLRGVDAFFLWSPAAEARKEVELLHPVYAAAQAYGAFLDEGEPITFDTPDAPGPVVSGLRLGDRVLVRRTDFTDDAAPVTLALPGGGRITVPRADGACTVIEVE